MDLKKIIRETVERPKGDQKRFVAMHTIQKLGYKKPKAEDATAGNKAKHNRPADQSAAEAADRADDSYASDGSTNLDAEDEASLDQEERDIVDEAVEVSLMAESAPWSSGKISIKGKPVRLSDKDIKALHHVYNKLDDTRKKAMSSEITKSHDAFNRFLEFAHEIRVIGEH